MDLGLSEEQEILKRSAREFLAEECPKEKVRELDESDEGYSPELWKKIADLGWLGVVFPEEYGGSNGSFMDLVILLEMMGYNILPGPFFSTVILAGLPILNAGNDDQKKQYLSKISSGEAILTLALTEPSISYEASSISTKATAKDGQYIINGTKLFVPDANVADYILCVARTKETSNPEEGISIFIVDAKSLGIKCTLLKTLAHDKQNEIIFKDVTVPKENILGGLDQGWPIIKDLLEKAAVAKCAEMVGGTQAALEMSVQYANERTQFGRPIGTFQAIQHYCANMLIDVDGSRYITYEAAWKISENLPATKETSMAKAWVSDASQRVTMLGHQIHGAMGFTMEHDMHLYYRRAKAAAQAFNDSDYHREIVAREIGL
ncbi:MAG: acyl-CoA dehydrogenase family protein [Spirochaetota bacterium]|nr:acyl-CoA dehydrogenase family protein [Spirochaetota bacterium]